jgi:DNA-binding MurR/RpiR family transcriptional regulator
MGLEWNTAARFAGTSLAARIVELKNGSSGASVTLADAVLRDPLRVATAAIDELAALAGVSPASVSRFARALGFPGYPSLRSALSSALQDVLNPVEKLRDAVGRGGPLDAGLDAILSNVRATADALRGHDVSQAAGAIAAARCVFVVGFGLSAHSAGHLVLGLQPFCQQVVDVVGFGGNEVAAGRLMGVGAGDVVIAISVPRYARDALGLAAYARDRGAKVIAITDSPAAPLAAMADVVLLAPAAHPVLPSSSVAVLFVIETLVVALMTRGTDSVARAQELSEAIGSYLVP